MPIGESLNPYYTTDVQATNPVILPLDEYERLLDDLEDVEGPSGRRGEARRA
jgi:hypothetical protein